MALFGGKKKEMIDELVPASRVEAFAKLDLEKYLASNPVAVEKLGDIDWHVEYGEDGVAAFGSIKIPAAIYFEYGDLDNDTVADDLTVVRIDINGKRAMDDTIQKAEIPFDPLATVDTTRIEGQAKRNYHDL